jgi:hypothetical protein
MSEPNENRHTVKVERVTDNDILILMEAAALNAGSKNASIHQKQVFSALTELYQRRLGIYVD